MGSDFKVENRIVFYDGFCVVCSKFINLLINSDKNKLNKFTSISSKYAQKILTEKMKSEEIGKFIVYLSKDGKIYSRPLEDQAPFLDRDELKELMYISLTEESKK